MIYQHGEEEQRPLVNYVQHYHERGLYMNGRCCTPFATRMHLIVGLDRDGRRGPHERWGLRFLSNRLDERGTIAPRVPVFMEGPEIIATFFLDSCRDAEIGSGGRRVLGFLGLF